MAILDEINTIPPEEYLEREKYSEIKHEYVAGHVYAMVGVSRTHNLISLNLASVLRAHLRRGPCQVFMADMKVRTSDAFYYPDVMVSCDRSDRHEYFCERPVLIGEVTSPSTETRDNLEKRVAYQSISSLREYVLVSQSEQQVPVFRRTREGWELETCSQGDTVRLMAVELYIPMNEIYEDALQ